MGGTSDAWAWFMDELLELEDGTANAGTYTFKKGYHSSEEDNEENWPGNYSIRDAIDRQGPEDKSAAGDWTFRDAQRRDYSTIAKYMRRLRAAGKDPDDPRMDGWREVYGQADNDEYIEGYDFRYDKEVTSGPSHLWHIHWSETRKYINSMTNKRNALSVAKGESVAEWRAAGGKAIWEGAGESKPSVPSTRSPVKRDAPGDPRPFPLPRGYYFGPKRGPKESVSGYFPRTFKGHSDNYWIKEWVEQLQRRGWNAHKRGSYLSKYGNDGLYGPELKRLVRAFQHDQNLVEDGKLGPRTWNAAFLNPVT